jgi:hypothetical protein
VTSLKLLDAEYLFTFQYQFCLNLIRSYYTWMVNKSYSAIGGEKKAYNG